MGEEAASLLGLGLVVDPLHAFCMNLTLGDGGLGIQGVKFKLSVILLFSSLQVGRSPL